MKDGGRANRTAAIVCSGEHRIVQMLCLEVVSGAFFLSRGYVLGETFVVGTVALLDLLLDASRSPECTIDMVAGYVLRTFEDGYIPGRPDESAQLPQPESEGIILVVQFGASLSFGDDLLDSLDGSMRDVSVDLDLLSHELGVPGAVVRGIRHCYVHQDLVSVSDDP